MKTTAQHISHSRFGITTRSVVLAAAGISLLGLCASVTLVAQDEKSSDAIVAGSVPKELQDALTPLDNNWQAWSDSVSAELAQLYSADKQDPGSLRESVAILNRRMAVVEKSLNDPKYRSIEAPLRNLYGKLGRRLAILEAALDTMELPPEARTARLAAAADAVSAAFSKLEAHLKSIKNGGGWLVYLKADALSTALGGDEAGLTAALQDVDKRIDAAEKNADPAVSKFASGAEFQALKSAGKKYIALASNTNTANNSPATREQLVALIKSIEDYEAQPNTASAAAIRQAYKDLSSGTIDGGARLESALRANYFNYNMRVLASEGFINKFVKESRKETGPVRDFILGANVYGCQTTVTDISFDLKPDHHNARFEIKLAGRINSNTQGVTDQATIFTHGTHYFWANKPVVFDGNQFHTERARISVNANNNTVGAETNFSSVPLLGGIADGIAMGEAEKKRPQSEAIARGRVSGRVLPRLNDDVDAEFAKANLDLDAKVDGPLKELGLFPDAKEFRTSEDHLNVKARVMGSGELGGGTPFEVSVPSDGAVIQVHESWMNNSIDRLELDGKTMNEDELKTLFETRLKKLLGEDFKLPEGEVDSEYEEDTDDGSGPATLIFADHDPIRIQVNKDVLIIRILSGIQREDDDDIPTQEITIEVKFTIDGDHIRVERVGGISVAPVEKPASALKQITFAGIMKGIFQRATPPRKLKRARELKIEDKKVNLNIDDVEALDGWLNITVD